MTIPNDDRVWERLDDISPFGRLVGAMYVTHDRLAPGEDIRFAFRVAPDHCNIRPECHGGMLAMFVDTTLARGLRIAGPVPPPMPTISMSIDYLAPAPLGAWVEARVMLGRIGGTVSFSSVLLYVEEMLILRGSGVFRTYNGGRPGAV